MSVTEPRDLRTSTESILQEADRLVNGPRQAAYGHPGDDFARTAALASVLLAKKLVQALDARDIALVMIAVKLSREVNAPKRDNRVDGAGYFACLDMVTEGPTEYVVERPCS